MLEHANPLFELARRGRRITNAILVVVMALVFVLIAQIIGYLLLSAIPSLITDRPVDPDVFTEATAGTPFVQGASFAAMLALSFGLNFVLIGLWTRFREKRPLWTIGYPRAGALRQYLRGLGIGAAMCIVPLLAQSGLGYVAYEDGPPARQGLAALGGVLIIFLGWMIQGAAEEAITRGWVMQSIGARHKPWIGVLVSSLLFVLLHGLNPNTSVLAFVNLFLFSLFAAAYALREGSLWGISAWHSVWNWMLGNVLGLAVSGMEAPGGILLNLRETGPDLITGGAFGPEGGLATSAVLLAGIAVIVFGARRTMRASRVEN